MSTRKTTRQTIGGFPNLTAATSFVRFPQKYFERFRNILTLHFKFCNGSEKVDEKIKSSELFFEKKLKNVVGYQ